MTRADGPDWADGELRHLLVAELVDPRDHSQSLGALEVAPSGCRMTEGYYTDTRVSASLSVPDWSAYDGFAWVRLRHEELRSGWSETMMTGIVWDEGVSESSGALRASPTVVSALKALDADAIPCPLVMGQGGRALSAAAKVCSDVGRPWRALPGATDYRFTDPRVWDAGTSRISVLFDLLELAGDRLGVDPDGVVTAARYVEPSRREPSMTLDALDPHGVVLATEMRRSSDSHQVPGRSIATWKGTVGEGDDRRDEQVGGYADVGSSHFASPGRRGYVVSEVHQVNDMAEPRTVAHAQRLARGFLPGDSAGTDEWEVECLWVPLHQGDAVDFRPPVGGPRLCLVKAVDVDLGAWTERLTLKEV